MGFLALLKLAPAILGVGKSLVESFTGETLSEDVTAETVAEQLEGLPDDKRFEAMQVLSEAKVKLQTLDTQRFESMNEGSAEKIRETARPQIALRAMAVIELFSQIFKMLMIITVAEWMTRLGLSALNMPYPDVSLWALIAKAEPVTAMIWPPLLASFWVCADIIKKYMGVRERDKAQQFEMQHGRPLESAAATVAAAGSNLANIIKAFKGN